ncbi:CRISPR-associated helicase Cas3' [Singulisphaera sp. Ch08]|uniref:CRISPR-associated helicase Cas3 n=1 Tax=Singulisphaera sp. Ch08 TaxID=3120278 RepID=A0AAU7CJ01_9BACT
MLGNNRAVELVLWAIAGHHRKFPPTAPPEDCNSEMIVYLSHPDFHNTLTLGTHELSLPDPPRFESDRKLKLTRINSSLREFEDAQEDAEVLMEAATDEEKRYVAVLKACLICADVAGSIGRRGSQSMDEWITQAFKCLPRPQQLESVVHKGLKGSELRPFQIQVAETTNRVVFVQAGCGSGKTSAAYLWAAQQAPGQRLFFCYPTTGTATEGFRDYLLDPSLDAELIHGRAEVDMEILGLGDDEPGREEDTKSGQGKAIEDSAGAMQQWSTPLVSCTVDTVLGLVQNHRRGIYAWPSIAGAALVFDEIHSYDDNLFSALVRFLTDVRGVRCLLMTASLPEPRLQTIRAALDGIGETLGGPIDGPEDLQLLKRYRREYNDSPWDRVENVLSERKKVLWVVNTVAEAMSLAEHPRAKKLRPTLYHSRFRYIDRVARHRDVIEAFAKADAPAFAITTQVAEMSLDLSADLLITHLAPIPALIQRLGRLNRRARPGRNDGIRPFIIIKPDGHLPYAQDQLQEASAWLASLGDEELSQADLAAHWIAQPVPSSDRVDHFVWLDGGFVTETRPLRIASPGIDIILQADRVAVESRQRRSEEVRIPMPPPRTGLNWRAWDEVAFCRVPPEGLITYDERKGAEWKR